MNTPQTKPPVICGDLVRRLVARWKLFRKSRRLNRMVRWLGCDARMCCRMVRLQARDETFAWRWFARNCQRMQRLNDKWGYIAKAPNK